MTPNINCMFSYPKVVIWDKALSPVERSPPPVHSFWFLQDGHHVSLLEAQLIMCLCWVTPKSVHHATFLHTHRLLHSCRHTRTPVLLFTQVLASTRTTCTTTNAFYKECIALKCTHLHFIHTDTQSYCYRFSKCIFHCYLYRYEILFLTYVYSKDSGISVSLSYYV